MPMRDHLTMEEVESAEATSQDSPAALEDRISQLPDSIIHQILSCPPLTIRDLVLMSILSKRWLDLWKSSPFLDLDYSHFLIDEDDDEDNERFARFVDTVLLLRDVSDLHRFHLRWFIDLHPHGQRHLYEWVEYAVNRNVKVIDLHFTFYEKEVNLPRTMFNCGSLEELNVMFHKMINPRVPKIVLPQNVCLPMLRKLRIKHMEIYEESMKKIIFGCHALEELILEDCWLISVILVCPKLTNLTVEGCFIGGDSFAVSCSELQSFHFIGNFIDVWLVLLNDLSSVVSATILTDYEEEHKWGKEYRESKYCGGTVDFIRGLANAKTLKFISSKIEIIPENVLPLLPHFPNLKNLTLGGWKMSEKFQVISHFIKQSPGLEMLTLTSAEISQENEGEAGRKTEQLWFHCPNTVISCRIQGRDEENEILLKLVCKVILSTHSSPDSKVRIVPHGRVRGLGDGSCDLEFLQQQCSESGFVQAELP